MQLWIWKPSQDDRIALRQLYNLLLVRQWQQLFFANDIGKEKGKKPKNNVEVAENTILSHSRISDGMERQ